VIREVDVLAAAASPLLPRIHSRQLFAAKARVCWLCGHWGPPATDCCPGQLLASATVIQAPTESAREVEQKRDEDPATAALAFRFTAPPAAPQHQQFAAAFLENFTFAAPSFSPFCSVQVRRFPR
jgi:hypothetical protein